jgi:hypothetical protein
VENVEVECNEPPKGPYISTYIVRLGEGEWIMTEPDVVMYPVATAKWEDGDPAYEGVYALAKGEKFDFKTATMDDNSDPDSDKVKHFYANKEKDVGGFAHEIEWKILDLIDSIQTKENNSSSPAKVVSEGSATAKPQKETPSASQPVQPSDSAIVAKSLHPQERRSKPQTAPKVAPPPVPRKTEDDADSQPLKVVPGGEIGIWSRSVQSLIPTPTDQIDDEAWAKAEALETSLKTIIAKYPGCNHTVKVGPDRNKTGLFMRVRVMDELGNSIMLGIQEGGQGNASMFWEESILGNPQRGKLDPMPMDRAISWMQEQIEFQSKESKHQLSSLIMNLPVISKPHPVKSEPFKEESSEDIKVSKEWERNEALVGSLLKEKAKYPNCSDRVHVSSGRDGIGAFTDLSFLNGQDSIVIRIIIEEKGDVLIRWQESILGIGREEKKPRTDMKDALSWIKYQVDSQCKSPTEGLISIK